MPNILTTRNYKLDKSKGNDVATVGISLAPVTKGGGRSMCPNAGTCAKFCLDGTGRNITGAAHAARIRRTQFWQRDPKGFVEAVSEEIRREQRKAEANGMTLAVRANILSDQALLALMLAKRHPDLQFYDYTKLPFSWARMRGNYHLTYSLDTHNHAEARRAMAQGVNVAVAFDVGRGGELPERWTLPGESHTRPVLDGDANDLRYHDPAGHIVGLRFKGSKDKRRAAVQAGFVFDPTIITTQAA